MTESTTFDERTLRMRAALSPVLALGPEFLSGRRDADAMAHTMVRTVQEFVLDERAHQQAERPAEPGRSPGPASRATQELEAALTEIYTCGSGYLADRCDSACVARTMTQLLDEFGSSDRVGRPSHDVRP